jgi:hypothetical protein
MTDPQTFTFTQAKLDRIIKARIAAVRASLQPRIDLADELQAALTASVAQLNAAEAQLAQLGVEPVTPAVEAPEPAQAVEPEEPEEAPEPPRSWTADDFTGSAADRVAARLAP